MISGGYNFDGVLSSTEIYDAELDKFEAYVDMPKALDYHVLVNVNSTHMVLVGGRSPSKDIYLFDRYDKVKNIILKNFAV